MTENKSRIRSLPRNVWIVTATSFLTDISSEMIVNLIPLFLSNVLGVRTAVIGLIDGVAETTASLTEDLFRRALRQARQAQVADRTRLRASRPWPNPFLLCQHLGLGAGRALLRTGSAKASAPPRATPWSPPASTSDQRGLAFGLHRAGDTAGAFMGIWHRGRHHLAHPGQTRPLLSSPPSAPWCWSASCPRCWR